MYNDFKNNFVIQMATDGIQFNDEQYAKILDILDRSSRKYDFITKNNRTDGINENGIPSSVYEYIHSKEAEGCAKGTLYVYRVTLEVFFRCVKKAPQYITSNDIIDFLMKYKENTNISNRSLDKYRGYIGGYFTYMHDFGYIPQNPSKQVKAIKYEIKPKPVLNEYEMELIREACITRREKAIVEFFISTACRVAELTNVKISDINWETDEVTLFGKGSKYRTSYITPRCKLYLQRYLQYRDETEGNPENEYLFLTERAPHNRIRIRSVQDMLAKIMERIPDITKHCSPHRLRSSTSTLAYINGMPLDVCQAFLGHKNIRTTQIYVEQNTAHVHGEHRKYVH